MSRIVVFSDGTSASPDKANPTNVLVTARSVLPEDSKGTRQLTFYDAGVGTGNLVDQYITGGLMGGGLNKNIEDTYRFLMHNYQSAEEAGNKQGDEVFLFGFSRGAYTVRSLVGLIYNVGLLRKDESDRVGEAMKTYRDRNLRPDSSEAREFRSRYSREIPIKFLGVWDTVAALGLLIRPFTGLWTRTHGFHDAKLSEIVDNAYQGLAIDEKRRIFKASVWSSDSYKIGQGKRGNGRETNQIVEQVWFSGAHSDIGGSYPKHGLSDIALRWMLGKATKLGLEVGLDDEEGHVNTFAKDTVPVVINDSRPKVTKAYYAYHREYGVTNPGTESVHHTVIENYKGHRTGPRPKNLSKYLESGSYRITDKDGNITVGQ